MPKKIKQDDQQKIVAATGYIKKHLSVHHTPDLLALKYGFSTPTFIRYFKTINKKPVYEFLIDERMKYALDKIQNTDEEIKLIAFHCGYEPRSFHNAFKSYFGHPPGYYRQSDQTNEYFDRTNE